MPMIWAEISWSPLNAFFNMTSIAFYSKHLTGTLRILAALLLSVAISSCEVDDPEKEEVPELITKVILRFESETGGEAIVATATDPDGEGVGDIEIDQPIKLALMTSYSLEIMLVNDLADITQPEYDVSEEVREEAGEHMFFFEWTDNLFAVPSGSGNIENSAGIVGYLDEDENGLPLGLETKWTTSGPATGEFRIVLKHQPDLKSAQSDARTGETDLDVVLPVNVE